MLWPALRQHVYLALIAVVDRLRDLDGASRSSRTATGWVEQPTILVTTFLYTIPSLALFELLVAPVGANVYAAEIALVSYTLLILFRNTLTGLRDVPERGARRRRGDGHVAHASSCCAWSCRWRCRRSSPGCASRW